jgi:histidine phosphotransfer protein HptB
MRNASQTVTRQNLYDDIEVPPELEPLIPGFLERREQDIAHLTDCISKSDFETVGRIGHKLHGNGGGFGFSMITQIGIELENAAKNKNEMAIRELTLRLFDIVHDLKNIFIK